MERVLTEEAMERVKREWNVGKMKRRREGREGGNGEGWVMRGNVTLGMGRGTPDFSGRSETHSPRL